MCKTSILAKSLIFFSAIILVQCAMNDEVALSPTKVNLYDSHVNVYDTLRIAGEFKTDIAAYLMILENENAQNFELALTKATGTKIETFIPKDFKAGVYSVALRKGSGQTSLTNISLDPVKVYIRTRPVILSVAPTYFKNGTSLVINGINFTNSSGDESYNPKVWITTTGYANTTASVIVNSAGTVANVNLDANVKLNPGNYDLYLTTGNGPLDTYEPASNFVHVTVVP